MTWWKRVLRFFKSADGEGSAVIVYGGQGGSGVTSATKGGPGGSGGVVVKKPADPDIYVSGNANSGADLSKPNTADRTSDDR